MATSKTGRTGNEIKNFYLDLHEITKQDFLLKARAVAAKLAKQNGSVSINEVREKVTLPPGMHPSVYGAVFRGKTFKHSGDFARASHPAGHARLVGIYYLNEERK